MKLLTDILSNEEFLDFREALAARVEAEARRKRITAVGVRLALAASLVLCASLLMTQRPVPRRFVAAEKNVLRTVALRADQILVTSPLAESFAFVTDRSQAVPSISDVELLELFPNHPTALASTTDGARQFLFLDPDDARAFSVPN